MRKYYCKEKMGEPIGNADIRKAQKAQVESASLTAQSILDAQYAMLQSIIQRIPVQYAAEGVSITPARLWTLVADDNQVAEIVTKNVAKIMKIVIHENKQLTPIISALVQQTVDIYDPASTGSLVGPPTALPSIVHVHPHKATFFPGGPDANVCQTPIDTSCTSRDGGSTVHQLPKPPVYSTLARKREEASKAGKAKAKSAAAAAAHKNKTNNI